MQNLKIQAVVVTYNRKELLLECINAILNQTYKIEKLIIIDNNSIDGTYEILKKLGYIDNSVISYKKLEKNIGGAGGFHEGIKIARESNSDWIWIMDDDTIPRQNTLEELVNSLELLDNEKIGYLASSQFGENGQAMNVPKINNKITENGYSDWYKYLEYGIVKITEATFVSILINGKATKEVGLPVKDYFIWGDDTEYTLRLNKYYGNAYLIGKSIVTHKRKSGKALSIINENNKDRLKMYYYLIRNNYINIKEYEKKKEIIYYIYFYLKTIFIILFSKKSKFKLYKVQIIVKSFLDAIFKKYDSVAFKNRLKS